VIFGDDPWGIIVRAVNTTLAAREFANDALCSVETARRGGLSGCCAERFSDRDNPSWECRPAVTCGDGDDDALDDAEPSAPSIAAQVETLARLFNEHGWPQETTAVAAEIILRRLADVGSRPAAYEQLRREKRWCVMTNLRPSEWTALLRLLLGDPSDWAGITPKGQGVLLRLALDEPVADLARDPDLADRIRQAAPSPHRRAA